MADLVIAAAQGNLNPEFTLLYNVVTEAVTNKSSMFGTILRDIKLTLDSLLPYVEENRAEHDISDQATGSPNAKLQSFKTIMGNGVELVHKSSNLKSWSVYKKYKYATKFIALDKSLQNLADILRIQSLRDLGKTWSSMKNRDTVVTEMAYWNTEPELPSFTVGMYAPLMEVKMRLLKDSVSMLVLTGPGGCGKTTLARMLCQDTVIRDQFRDNIVFVTFAKQPSLSLILQQLNQHMGYEVFNSKVGVIAELYTFLKNGDRSLLLIFDDVWHGSESLLQLFIPEQGKHMANYKVLVTSRFQFPGLGSPFQLNLLNAMDSMTLFRHSASLGDESSYFLDDLLIKIVEHCKGLPLAILVVGKSLRGKPIEIWQSTLSKWSKGSSFLDSEKALRFRLQSSLDELGKQDYVLQESFIDLASFPENQAIPVPALIDMWAELYELREDIMCIENLYELTTRSLANIVVRRKVEEGYYSEHFVTQHDLLRSLAIHQTRDDPVLRKRVNIDMHGDNLPKWWTDQKKKIEKTRLLSISTDGEFSTKWPIMQLPKPQVLVLNFWTKDYALPEFIKDMNKSLKVLIVIKYGSMPAEISQFHLLSSLSNLKTIRLHWISFPSVTENPINLKSLQKISFFMCNISQAFGKGAVPISHAMPILVEINIEYCRDLVELQDDICNLAHLKKLSITNCHMLSALPEELGKLINLEMLRLRSCTDLVTLPGSIGNLKELKFLDISHCFSIRELPEEIGELRSLRKLNMRDCSRLRELPLSFINLEELREVMCDEDSEGLLNIFVPMVNLQIRVLKEEFNLNWLQY